jgi:hypothetical protein
MPFVKMPGVTGKVYVPEKPPEKMKKHECRDCFSCQMCSDDRCTLCRPEDSGKEGEGRIRRRRCDGQALIVVG